MSEDARIQKSVASAQNVSPIEWACLGVGSVLVLIYAWVMDDAYIYFRYVDNLVIHGSGLVYNPGEFVEGFSSPFWALLLATVRALHANYWLVTRAVGLLCFWLFWWFAVQVNAELAGGSLKPARAIDAPLVYLTMSYGVMSYFTSGLESPFVLVAAAATAVFFCRPEARQAQLLLGLSPMIRHELALPFAIAVGWFVLRKRRLPWVAVVTCAFSMGSYELFRIWYYADLVPNTFYVKDVVWITQGLEYLYETLSTYDAIPYLGSAALIAYATRSGAGVARAWVSPRVMMLVAALPVVVYVVKIGGDPRHFRYLAFPFCLTVLATGGLVERLVARGSVRFAHAAIATALFALLAFSNYPRQLLYHPVVGNTAEDLRTFLRIKDAEAHRISVSPRWYESGTDLSYDSAVSIAEHAPRADVISAGLCVKAYLNRRRAVIHAAGLTDPFLARIDVPFERPAHSAARVLLSRRLSKLRKTYGFGRGVFAQIASKEPDTRWIATQLDTFEQIEARAYNEHNFVDNVALAFSRIGRIAPPTGSRARTSE